MGKVSRDALFNDFNNDTSDDLDFNYDNESDFEFVQVEDSVSKTDVVMKEGGLLEGEREEEGGEPETEMFKLFNTQDTQAISLRDDIEDEVVNERPESYYFSSYSIEERDQFKNTAITFEQLLMLQRNTASISSSTYRVLDVNAYNEAIEKAKLDKKRRGRPGKKKRLNRIACKERKLERKKIEAAKAAAIKKKKFHKRGGKKNNKKKEVSAKPKYRTE
ncbi:uncharacterized protein KQ657_001867 [Scheffersomyces spartinae]|uniref:Uncharacterized protein n=1 Tax=Scheffersomyces spartinae TaxID=45513 RepID=A0A9P7V766_9ASCO|nr:uncharacterized protein KQ657_001867 [Scheffersomyces spartinae]KAG7192466.1 hypothetical protein KQ657_001867 [Scheffersomyces spartinae]